MTFELSLQSCVAFSQMKNWKENSKLGGDMQPDGWRMQVSGKQPRIWDCWPLEQGDPDLHLFTSAEN